MSLTEVTGATVSLRPGAMYYAKAQLTGAEATFGGAGDIQAALVGEGFNSVSVWSSNPPSIFPDRAAYTNGDTYWASAIYTGVARATAMPSEVKRVWIDEALAQPVGPSPEPSPSPSPSVNPEPSSAGTAMNFAQLRALAISAGFPSSDADTAAAIALAESGGDPCANGDPHNSADCNQDFDSTSFGLWQIHVTAHPEYDSSQLKNSPAYNAAAAYAIYKGRGGDFQDWSTYNNGDYLNHMPAGSRAMPVIKTVLGVAALSFIFVEVSRYGVAGAWNHARAAVRRYV